MTASRRVLVIAFHFPPCRGSSGIQRTLKFVRYLPREGWQPIVLSASPWAYEERSDDLLDEIPADVPVYRAWALDAARHLAIRGRYLGVTERPDRWLSWSFAAAAVGRWLIRRYRPAVIWSTYPIPTALLIGSSLQRASSLPWVVDLRDAMVDDDYPAPGPRREQFQRIEARSVAQATRVVLTTESARQLYRERYPQLPADRWAVIRNGFDEDNFVAAQRLFGSARPADGCLRLIHSGLLQPSERDPRPFFAAVRLLKNRGVIAGGQVQILLRASGHDELYRTQVRAEGIEDIVQLEPSIGHYEALGEMLNADGLLLFQGGNCNHLVPAKLYEYFRAGRPILALTDLRGETAALMREHGLGFAVDMTSAPDIATALARFVDDIRQGRAPVADAAARARYSRRQQATELAALLSKLK